MNAFADDDFGATAADIDHQSPARFARHGLRDTQVDQAGFFDAGDDFDGMAERGTCAIEERAFALCAAKRIRADHANAFRFHIVKALTEALETRDRAFNRMAIKTSLLVEPGRQPHHLAQAVLNDQLPMRVAGNDHVKTVGSQIDRGNDVRDFARHQLFACSTPREGTLYVPRRVYSRYALRTDLR
jgi:hypothetical protein